MRRFKSQVGMTLVELLITTSLASIVILTGSYLLLLSQSNQSNQNNNLDTSFSSYLVSKILRKELYSAGGAYVFPWNAVVVENNCIAAANYFPNCAGTDRITVANELIDPVTQNFMLNLMILSFDQLSGGITIDSTLGCPVLANMVNRHVFLSDPTKTIVYLRWITSVDLPNCRFETAFNLQGAVLNSANANASWTNFNGGTLSFVELKTIYYDESEQKIMMLKKSDNSTTVATADLTVIADSAFDLQFALGYDAEPHDGLVKGVGPVSSAPDKTTDEILFNSPLDLMTTINGGGAVRRDLRMILAAVTLGTRRMKSSQLGNSMSFFDGPVVNLPDVYLFGFEQRFFLRNTSEFR